MGPPGLHASQRAAQHGAARQMLRHPTLHTARPWPSRVHRQQTLVTCMAAASANAGACALCSSSVTSSLTCRGWSSRQPGRWQHMVCHAAGMRKQLPIFPLGVVALPHAMVPLLIFEPRYRVLFSTLLDGEEGVEQGLVQKESPFCGTRTFGMCFLDERGRLASIGTTLRIEEHVHESDGRIYVTCKGVERFRVVGVAKERPVLLCDVEVLPEDDDESEQAKALANEVAELFRNTLRLHLKMSRRKAASSSGSSMLGGSGSGATSAAELSEEDEAAEPEQLTELNPCKLSYWIANVFQDSRYTQQSLLEDDSTLSRLEKEREVLASTLKFYSAATALEGVFAGGSSGEGGVAQPPPGGPD